MPRPLPRCRRLPPRPLPPLCRPPLSFHRPPRVRGARRRSRCHCRSRGRSLAPASRRFRRPLQRVPRLFRSFLRPPLDPHSPRCRCPPRRPPLPHPPRRGRPSPPRLRRLLHGLPGATSRTTMTTIGTRSWQRERCHRPAVRPLPGPTPACCPPPPSSHPAPSSALLSPPSLCLLHRRRPPRIPRPSPSLLARPSPSPLSHLHRTAVCHPCVWPLLRCRPPARE